jgi:hypothetical protein
MVDSYFPRSVASTEEPPYVLDTKRWKKHSCVPFLDSEKTRGIVSRTLWTGFEGGKEWGEYCLLERV